MELFGALIISLIGRGTTFLMLYLILFIISRLIKMLSQSDIPKGEEIVAVKTEAVLAHQGSYSQFAIRKITEKSKVEERLITPIGPIVNRKY